jgi:hypothetical protein
MIEAIGVQLMQQERRPASYLKNPRREVDVACLEPDIGIRIAKDWAHRSTEQPHENFADQAFSGQTVPGPSPPQQALD